MQILVAPDKFKGSLSAVAAVEAITRGLHAVWPDAEISAAPIADGGEGFAEALCQALGGEWVETRALDPIGREVPARYAWVAAEQLAIIEMSEASGIWRLTKDELAPLRANTFGTGQLIRHATERGARKILVGLGGSATTDGGVGMAAALGYEFLTSDGEELALFPSHLIALTRIQPDGAIDLPEIIAACDVQNPLLGPRGTAHVFSPQKGAAASDIVALEGGLSALADCVTTDLGCDFRETPGAGAAGGIAFGLMSFCGATVCSGFDLVPTRCAWRSASPRAISSSRARAASTARRWRAKAPPASPPSRGSTANPSSPSPDRSLKTRTCIPFSTPPARSSTNP